MCIVPIMFHGEIVMNKTKNGEEDLIKIFQTDLRTKILNNNLWF